MGFAETHLKESGKKTTKSPLQQQRTEVVAQDSHSPQVGTPIVLVTILFCLPIFAHSAIKLTGIRGNL